MDRASGGSAACRLSQLLLPRLRGLNPTVTALIAGADEIGVSAFQPADGEPSLINSGPVFGQEKISIRYPITIQDAYKLLGLAYCRLAERLVNSAGSGALSFLPQKFWKRNIFTVAGRGRLPD